MRFEFHPEPPSNAGHLTPPTEAGLDQRVHQILAGITRSIPNPSRHGFDGYAAASIKLTSLFLDAFTIRSVHTCKLLPEARKGLPIVLMRALAVHPVPATPQHCMSKGSLERFNPARSLIRCTIARERE